MSGAPRSPARRPRLRRTYRAALVAVLASLAACGGGGGGGGPAPTGAGRADGFTLVDLGSHPFVETVNLFGISLAATAPIELEIARDTVSFAVLTDVSGTGRLGGIADLTSPSGRALTAGSSIDDFLEGPLKPGIDDGAVGLLLPKSPSLLPEPGTYRFRVVHDGRLGVEVPVRAAVRRGPNAGRTIPLNLMVHSLSGVAPDALDGVIARARQIYQQAGMDLDPVRVFTGGGLLNAVITGLGPGSNVESLFAIRGPLANAATIYLVLDVDLDATGTLLGVAAGIPGSFGFPRPTDNGVILSASAHRGPLGALAEDFLATTLAHELGHWLGLNHTSESGGDAFDPIADTPQCAIASDRNGNQRVDPDECADGPNLMFWTGITNSVVSSDQAEVLRRTPLAAP